jgi:hypothetical protein
MVISQKTFGGLMPRVEASLLPDNAATVAHDCRLRSGKLAPMKQSASFMDYPVRLENGLVDMADALSLYLWKRGTRKEFLTWPGFVTVAPSNLFDDDRYRVFVAGATGKHGAEVEIPPAPVMSAPEVDPIVDPTLYIQNAFVQTYVDNYGRESACSPISNYITYKDPGTPVRESIVATIASGDVPANVLHRRIYKVLGVYGDKLYVKTNKNGDWEDDLTAGAFDAFTITLNSANDDAKQTLYFSEQFINQPCVYVSAIDNGGFDRSSICLEKLPACGVTRSAVPPNAALTANLRYTFFYQTWVNEYGYESQVSDASGEITYNDGDQMSITAVTPVPEGAVARRIYKVVTGTETESIQFVWEQAVGTNEFGASTFTVKDEDAGDILTPMTECPRDLAWIANVPGNFYAGFATSKPRQVCFSEINVPTSWPNAYRYDVREDTVGLAVSGNTVFVLTVGQPYAISGTDPAAMTVSRIASNQGCVSKYSICTMNNAVFYASQDGVCMLSEGSQSEIVMTKSLFTKEQWTELNPSSCLMATHDTALHMFFTKTDGTRVAYVLDMIEGDPVLTTQSDVANAIYADVESDGLYIIKEVLP